MPTGDHKSHDWDREQRACVSPPLHLPESQMLLHCPVAGVIICGRRAPRPGGEADRSIPEARWSMSTLQILLIIWGVITAVLVLLWIYRSTLSMHEDDAMFIDDSSKNLREEQEAL